MNRRTFLSTVLCAPLLGLAGRPSTSSGIKYCPYIPITRDVVYGYIPNTFCFREQDVAHEYDSKGMVRYPQASESITVISNEGPFYGYEGTVINWFTIPTSPHRWVRVHIHTKTLLN